MHWSWRRGRERRKWPIKFPFLPKTETSAEECKLTLRNGVYQRSIGVRSLQDLGRESWLPAPWNDWLSGSFRIAAPGFCLSVAKSLFHDGLGFFHIPRRRLPHLAEKNPATLWLTWRAVSNNERYAKSSLQHSICMLILKKKTHQPIWESKVEET